MIGFIVRNQKESDRAQDLTRGETILFLATNTDAYQYSLKKSKDALLLGEEPLASRHLKINRWAFESMLALIGKYRHDEKKSLYLDSFFYDLRSSLVFCLKTLLVLERTVRDRRIRTLRFFKKQDSLLEMSLSAAVHVKSPLAGLKIEKERALPESRGKRDPKGVIRALLAGGSNWLSFVLTGFWRFKEKKLVLASGSARHLGDTLRGLRAAGREILHVETVFNFEQFYFAARNGFAYRVIRARRDPANPFQSEPPFDRSDEISFEGRDLGRFFNEIFMSFEKIGLLNFSFDAPKLRGLLSQEGVGAVLLDEEFAQRRQIAVQAGHLGLPAYVVSHGVPANAFLNTDEGFPAESDLHHSTDIFVNSEFEKKAYRQIFYASSKIHPIGVPRYDLLKQRLSRSGAEKPLISRKKKILYCSCGFIPYDFEYLSVVNTHLGLAANVSREAEEANLKDLFAAVSRNPGAVLQIKSKYGDHASLRDFVKKNAGRACVEILPSDADIFELEKGADVIVTAPSSVVCEALMHRKPVIVFNRSYALITDTYEERGVAVVVRDADELKAALTRCLADPQFVSDLAAAQSAHAEYFTGRYDSGSVVRITERILKSR